MSSRELVIPALVARHAEDAAFYWSQQDTGNNNDAQIGEQD